MQNMFHFNSNRHGFHFLLLHINKRNTFCFLISNGRVYGMTQDLKHNHDTEPRNTHTLHPFNVLIAKKGASFINSEYDQEIPHSQTTDKPMVPRGRATQQSRDTRNTN